MGLSLGAYLTQPVTEKHSANEEDDKMIYGVSSMQGWRETQEDAHNCILNFDTGTSFFAVYDGHGGNEVSEYTSQHLPDFLKENEFYKKGDWEKALKDSFVKFDCTLREPEVVKVLQKLAKYNDGNDDDGSESEDENLGNLKAEAQMTIEEVMAKYISNHKESKNSSELVKKLTKKVAAVYSKDLVKCSEVSCNETETSSSKPVVNESDSEVSSSSSSCPVGRKSLSELYKNNKGSNNNSDRKTRKTIHFPIDSTSNASLSSNGGSQADCKSGNVSSDSKSKAEKNEESMEENSESVSPSRTDEKEEKVNCNGNQVEEAISSSVENGESEGNKVSKKGKALIKIQKKSPVKKDSESSDKLFQKFINSDSNEDLSESDSDDVTFNGPESRSDDDDDDDEEEEGGKETDNTKDNKDGDVEEGDEEGEEEDDDDDDDDDNDDDDDDDDEEDEDSEDYEYENERDKCFMEPGSDSGCTALVALIKGNKLYVANAGDCRCVISKNGEAIEMSLDHKPENDIELERIEKAGGRVYAGRVNDGLNLSRALGDHVYKQNADFPPEEQMISPLPDIQVMDLDPSVEFMVLACDGIWNSMSSKEVVDFVRPRLQNKTDNLSKICEEMFDHCLAPNTLCDGTGCDNMTAIIVQFKNSNFFSSRKRPIDDSEAEESAKKQKTDDVTSTDSSIGEPKPAESFSEKPSNSPDTTQ